MIHSRPNSDDRVHLNTNDVLSQRPKAEREAALTIWPNTKSTNILAEFGKDSPKERRILRKVKGAAFPIVVLGIIFSVILMLFFYDKLFPSQKDLNAIDTCDEPCQFVFSGRLTAGDIFISAKQRVRLMLSNRNDIQIVQSLLLNISHLEVVFLTPQDHRTKTLSHQFEPDINPQNAIFTIGTQLVIIDDRHIVLSQTGDSMFQQSHGKLSVSNCSCLVEEFIGIFTAYWKASHGEPLTGHVRLQNLPLKQDPPLLITEFNASLSVAASPDWLAAKKSESELASLLQIINSTTEFLYISMTEFIPGFTQQFWPELDNALRTAVFNKNVSVCLLVNNGPLQFVRSLQEFSPLVSMRYTNSADLSYTINENSYMIGVHSWTGDYFLSNTTGISLIGHHVANVTDRLHSLLLNFWFEKWNLATAD